MKTTEFDQKTILRLETDVPGYFVILSETEEMFTAWLGNERYGVAAEMFATSKVITDIAKMIDKIDKELTPERIRGFEEQFGPGKYQNRLEESDKKKM